MPATPVNIISISRANGVVTVTTQLAHGLNAGQAVWIQGEINDATFNGIYVTASIINASSFTINQAGANASPVAAGTVQPVKQWIAEQLLNSQGGEIDLQVEMWFPVSSGNELIGGTGSALSSSKLQQDEINAIAAGRIFVVTRIIPFPNSYTGAQMQAYVNALYNAILTFRNTTLADGQFYGFFSDGTANLGRV